MRASAPGGGGAQRAVAAWLPEIVAFADAVFRPDGRSSMVDEYPCLFDPGNAEHLFVHRERGGILGLVGALPCTLLIDGRAVRAASIGSVATAPARRGRGVASALLVLAEETLRAEDCRVLLISGERGLYERFGAVRVGKVRWCRVERPLRAHGELAVAPLRRERLADAARLYDRRRTRYVRTGATLERLFTAAGFAAAERGEQTGLIAFDGDEPRAYAILVRGARNYPGATLVTEWAGDAEALVQIFNVLLARGAAALLVPLLEEDADLAARLPSAAEAPSERFPYTAKVIDGVGIWQDLGRPGGLALTESAPGLYTLDAGGASRALGAAELTSLLFAPRLPGQWCADALAAICPFPFVWPQGLNYV